MFYAPVLGLPDDGIPIDSGLWPGPYRTVIPIWQDGRNVRFLEGSIQADLGFSSVFNTGVSIPIKGIGQQLVSAGQRIFFGTRSTLYRWDTASVSQMATGFTGADDATLTVPATYWQFVPWGTWMLATNGKDPVQIYKGSSFANLTGATFTWARILLKWGPYVIAFNTSNGGDKAEWCETDNVENYTPVAGNGAGNYTFRDLETEIKAAVLLGKLIAVFSGNSLQIGQYVGANYTFGFSPALQGIGAVGPSSVVAVGRFIYGRGPLGFWKTDGSSYEYIDEAIRDWFNARINKAQLSKVCCYYNEDEKRVEFSYPTGSGENNETLCYYTERKIWTIKDYGRSSYVKKDVFDYPISGASDGKIFYQNFGFSANGSWLDSYIQSKPFPGGDESIWKWIDNLVVEGKSDAPLKIDVGFMNSLDEAPTFKSAVSVAGGANDLSSAPFFVEESGRWVVFKIYRVTPNNSNWKVGKIRVRGAPLGGPT